MRGSNGKNLEIGPSEMMEGSCGRDLSKERDGNGKENKMSDPRTVDPPRCHG
jgi:hypothetical protein